ncbi:uncharacterized protein LOC121837148 [Ixodes scapularis]|uniref:uncharacterized protein LOC115311797 n=1 Tax=Ixodes scapularis TaxID=6945 RepID=UPI001161A6C3|nr:uncharacterized protein LOC115311797 [Ixodes scapularis]XP_042148586.1 uncharacterized protein LOC121837148 [Ixodes scapularis]
MRAASGKLAELRRLAEARCSAKIAGEVAGCASAGLARTSRCEIREGRGEPAFSITSKMSAMSAALNVPAVRSRFVVADDILLLQEVAATNPFEDHDRWRAVTEMVNKATGKNFTARAIRERCDLLLGHFRREDRANLRKSGTEEQYSEKEHLLQEINDMAREFGHQVRVQPRKVGMTPGNAIGPGSRTNKASARAELHAANAIRETAVTAINAAAAAAKNVANAEEVVDEDSDNIMGEESPASLLLMQMCENGARSTPAVATPATGGPSQSTSTDGANGSDRTRSPPPPRARTAALRGKKKTRDGDVAAFLQQRSHQERAIRERELDIEERRLALDEKRLEFERERFAEEAQARAEERRELSEQRRIMFEFLLGQAKRN